MFAILRSPQAWSKWDALNLKQLQVWRSRAKEERLSIAELLRKIVDLLG